MSLTAILYPECHSWLAPLPKQKVWRLCNPLSWLSCACCWVYGSCFLFFPNASIQDRKGIFLDTSSSTISTYSLRPVERDFASGIRQVHRWEPKKSNIKCLCLSLHAVVLDTYRREVHCPSFPINLYGSIQIDFLSPISSGSFMT